ncbi:hypothetical protein RUND412_001467 [Rhizina undulata]
MSDEIYTPQPYTHKVFDQLQYLELAQKTVTERQIDPSVLSSLRTIFHRHNVQKRFGLTLLHRHFDMTPNEKLVEFRDLATPWILPDSDEIFGGNIVPKCWAFYDGELYPTEFGFNPSGENAFTKSTFHAEFVDELYQFLSHWDLKGVFGLVSFNHKEVTSRRGIERTVGRVSITLPATDAETSTGVEAVWAFGCQESMNDSRMWPARICWVCEGCKK